MADPAPRCIYVPPHQREALDALRATGQPVADLVRRGVDHGAVVIADLDPPLPADPDADWNAGRPIHLPGVLAAELDTGLPAAVATWQAFERFRDGGRLLDEIDARIADDEEFQYSGTTIDLEDQRVVENVFVDVPAVSTGGRRMRDLSTRLAWTDDDENDASMQIRCSFGHQATHDRLAPDVRALWSDRLTARIFPETRLVTTNATIRAFLADVLPVPHRLGECSLHSRAPGGGTMFHHDADPGQRGVVFAQLLGICVWLAASKHELAELAARHATMARWRDPQALLSAMDGDPDPELWTLLNATPALTEELARAGSLFVIRAGDVVLLPSIDGERCAWHSVFGVGTQASLALSFGIFDALPPMPWAPPND